MWVGMNKKGENFSLRKKDHIHSRNKKIEQGIKRVLNDRHVETEGQKHAEKSSTKEEEKKGGKAEREKK